MNRSRPYTPTLRLRPPYIPQTLLSPPSDSPKNSSLPPHHRGPERTSPSPLSVRDSLSLSSNRPVPLLFQPKQTLTSNLDGRSFYFLPGLPPLFYASRLTSPSGLSTQTRKALRLVNSNKDGVEQQKGAGPGARPSTPTASEPGLSTTHPKHITCGRCNGDVSLKCTKPFPSNDRLTLSTSILAKSVAYD